MKTNTKRTSESISRRLERRMLRKELQAYVDSYNESHGWKVGRRNPGFKRHLGPALSRGLRRLTRRPYLVRRQEEKVHETI